jgi:hypothetical protein
MNATYHYSVPPKGYQPFYDSSSPSSPHNSNEYVYYAPQYEATPRRHSRKPSYTTTPKPGGWHSPAGYPSPGFYETVGPDYMSPIRKSEKVVYVSEVKGQRSQPRRMSVSYKTKPSPPTKSYRKAEQPIHVSYDNGASDAEIIYREPNYVSKSTKTTTKTHERKGSKANQYFYFNQEQIYDEQPKRSRTRRSSSTSRPSPQKTKSSKPHYTNVSRQATADDAAAAGIPAGYSIKNWDPTEAPVILLGSVFDANSLGKWIYDWTVYHHGASTPMADVAGDLWLLLIKLAGKRKRAEECVGRIKSIDSAEMVEDFIESGSRLWQKFKLLLKECERYMWKAAKREGSKGVSMGKNAGTEFVDSIFGRDRELEETEKLMNSIRLWNMRFDANCEDILRRPSAA